MLNFKHFIKERYAGAEKERSTWYHGTAYKFLKKILSSGLLSNPKNKVWGDDKTHGSGVSRVSYGGIYVTKNISTATLSSLNANEKFGSIDDPKLIVILSLQPRTLLADEDDFTHTLSDISTKNYIINSYTALTWFYMLQTQKSLETVMQEYVDKNIKYFKYLYKDQINSHVEDRLRQLLPAVWEAAVIRVASSFPDEYGEYWKSRIYGPWEASGNTVESSKPPEIPSPEEAEANFRNSIEPITRTLKSITRREDVNITGRIEQDIGFSGSNKIIAIASITTKKENDSYMNVITVHYGELPEQFKEDIRKRKGPFRLNSNK